MSTQLNSRQLLMWGLHDFSEGRGLEIGPLHSCVVPRGTADVSYLDVFDRDTLVAHYAQDGVVDPERIPEIDFVLSRDDRVLSIVEAVADAPRFDWVMASHVVEHVPDVVGWLAQVAEITEDGGRLVLAVPDHRYCFDHLRPATTVGQLLQAHDDGDTRPSVRAVYDSARAQATASAAELWAGERPGYERRPHTLADVTARLDRARGGEYVDSHCWTFTPGTFVEQLVELRELGLVEWAVEDHRPTRPGYLEFHTVLRRLPRHEPWTDELFAAEPVTGDLPDYLAEERDRTRQARDDARLVREQAARIEKLEQRLERKQARIAEIREAMHQARHLSRRARDRAERAEARAATLASSRRYRLGSAIVGPVDAVRRRLHR